MLLAEKQPQHRLIIRTLLCVLLAHGCSTTSEQPKLPVSSAAATQTAPPDVSHIKPGHGVGLVRLGDTRARVLELFPRKLNIDQEYAYDEPCGTTEIHWVDLEREAAGVFIFLKHGRVFQIASATPRYRTDEGITQESPPEGVRHHYPHLRAYVLVNSGAEIVGGRDLVYWVDRPGGIAFEFYYNRKLRRRLVYKVFVFEPDTEFLPEGCVESPQSWRELEPFSLEPRIRKKYSSPVN